MSSAEEVEAWPNGAAAAGIGSFKAPAVESRLPSGLAMAPSPADPNLGKRFSIADARAMITSLATDLEDARAVPGAAPLVETIERTFQQYKVIFDRVMGPTPSLNLAARHQREAAAELMRAEAARGEGSLDPVEALRRRDAVELAAQALAVRNRELSVADSISSYTNGKLGMAFTVTTKTSPRSVAKRHVDRLVDEALRGAISNDAIETTVSPDVAQWEFLWLARARPTYEERATTHGDALPWEAIEAAFSARHDAKSARRAWVSEKIKAARKAKKP